NYHKAGGTSEQVHYPEQVKMQGAQHLARAEIPYCSRGGRWRSPSFRAIPGRRQYQKLCANNYCRQIYDPQVQESTADIHSQKGQNERLKYQGAGTESSYGNTADKAPLVRKPFQAG